LPSKTPELRTDTHHRPSPVEVLAQLKPVYEGGVQTGGNSSALVDAAAAAVLATGAYAQSWAKACSKQPLARLVASAAVGVAPEIMGIGPAPAIRLLLARELGLDLERLNVNGGAIALGHPLAATGLRLGITLARELRRSRQRWGIASACVGGGQGMALLLENPRAA